MSPDLKGSALLIIDVQKDNIDFYPKHKRIIPKITALAEQFREKNKPIIHLLTEYKSKSEFLSIDKVQKRFLCKLGTKGAEEVDELLNMKDIYVKRNRWSAFYNTNLNTILKKHNIKTIILTGLLTHCCVLATAFDAYQRDYNVIFAKDCLSSYRLNLEKELYKFLKNSVGEVINSNKLIQ